MNTELLTRLFGGRSSHHLRLALATVLTLVTAMFTWVPPVSANVSGVQRVVAISDLNSSETRSATAKCPSGTKVISTGGTINGEVGPIVLTSIVPNETLTNVKVSAAEFGTGTPSKWSVMAIAVCAKSLAGLQRISIEGDTSSNPEQDVSAVCPTGKKALGGGITIKGLSGGEGMIMAVLPNASATSVSVMADESGDGTTKSWSVRAHAICVDASAVPELQLVQVQSALGSPRSQGATALCPQGKQVIGAGAGVIEVNGDSVGLFGITPDAALTRVNAMGMETTGGTSFTWRTAAVALCTTVS